MKKHFQYFILGLCLTAQNTQAQPGGWVVNPAAFQYTMTAVANILVDGTPNHLLNNHLGAFTAGDHLRGYATPIDIGGQAYYFLSLFAHQYKGDTLHFRAFLGADQKVYTAAVPVVFRHHLALGNIVEPLLIDLHLGEAPVIYSLPEANYEVPGCGSILDVQASDNQNSEGNGLTYSIAGGADAGKFAIHPQSGLLSWLNFSPDPAAPADANGDNRYELRVRVTDAASLSDEQLVGVTVVSAASGTGLSCPANQVLLTSAGGTGDCAASGGQTQAILGNPCALGNLTYACSGATVTGGSGQIPLAQAFNAGTTTVHYSLGGSGGQCSFTISVQDDEAPTLTCPANLTVSPTNNNPCSATVGSIDATYSDNCTAALTYLLGGANAGSGDGQASGQVLLPGATTVTYTAQDAAGGTATCAFTVTVSNCNTEFSGTIFWEHDGTSGVKDATVTLAGAASGNDLSDLDGTYLISIPPTAGNFTLTPAKNLNKLNGVTSADVTAIQQHLTNTAPLPAPFKRIAADVNKSNSITSVDATLLNQALAGSQTALNQITSWRFVPASYSFPNPNAPWGFPENIVLSASSGATGQNFKGIKLGDVVSTWANPANFGAEDTELVWHTQDAELTLGEEVAATFHVDAVQDLTSFQFRLRFDVFQLALVKIEPLGALPISMEHFGTYRLADGEIRVVWAQPKGYALAGGAPVFRLVFKALDSGGRLSEALALDPEDPELPARCYDSAFEESGVALQFAEATAAGTPDDDRAPALRVSPNPFVQRTVLHFSLPESGEAELRVRDAAGRVLFSEKKHYAAGKHECVLRLEGVSGVLLAELVTPRGVWAAAVVAVKN